jgi:hypothetical protein
MNSWKSWGKVDSVVGRESVIVSIAQEFQEICRIGLRGGWGVEGKSAISHGKSQIAAVTPPGSVFEVGRNGTVLVCSEANSIGLEAKPVAK